MNDDFLYKAIQFAKNAHGSQLRKYTYEPYISHPIAVSGLVASIIDNKNMIAAAILHDVIEDTCVTYMEIRHLFNNDVYHLVYGLTDKSRPEDGNRKRRKEIDRDNLFETCPNTKTIKLADLIDNTKTIVAFDPDFAKIYMEEKRLLLHVLRDGDTTLYNIADKLVKDYFNGSIITNADKGYYLTGGDYE